jgi:hypothetical protein
MGLYRVRRLFRAAGYDHLQNSTAGRVSRAIRICSGDRTGRETMVAAGCFIPRQDDLMLRLPRIPQPKTLTASARGTRVARDSCMGY